MARGLNEIESAYFLSGETPRRGFNITHIKAPRLQFSLLLSVYFFPPRPARRGYPTDLSATSVYHIH